MATALGLNQASDLRLNSAVIAVPQLLEFHGLKEISAGKKGIDYESFCKHVRKAFAGQIPIVSKAGGKCSSGEDRQDAQVVAGLSFPNRNLPFSTPPNDRQFSTPGTQPAAGVDWQKIFGSGALDLGI